MTTPMDNLFGAVEWTALPRDGDEPWDGVEPHATHEGTLTIAGFSFRVYQLSDGSRVLDADDVAAFFGGTITPF